MIRVLAAGHSATMTLEMIEHELRLIKNRGEAK